VRLIARAKLRAVEIDIDRARLACPGDACEGRHGHDPNDERTDYTTPAYR
jgi:hypothetical protein